MNEPRPTETVSMNESEFRALLDWRMCSDPFPEAVNIQIVDDWIARICFERGYRDFPGAYHTVLP